MSFLSRSPFTAIADYFNENYLKVNTDGSINVSGSGVAPGSPVTSGQPNAYADSGGNAVIVSDATPLPTIWNTPRGTGTDRSGTTSGTINTYTTLMAANANRKAWSVQCAAAYSIKLSSGTVFTYTASQIAKGDSNFTDTGLIQIASGTASQAYTSVEY